LFEGETSYKDFSPKIFSWQLERTQQEGLQDPNGYC